uniref:Protein kinase domain-containing protein n=1 Tax=Salix viminalis TaxID=40686 RepID=A0A6N2LY49_SALVM
MQTSLTLQVEAIKRSSPSLIGGEISRHPFGAYAALLLLQILSTHHRCSARKSSNYCAPSSYNVSLTLHLNMEKYYVEAINYSDSTIRLVDAAVQKDDCFSIPHHSLTEIVFYSPYFNDSNSYYYEYNYWLERSVLTFICCENEILNPPDYIMDTYSCKNGSGTAHNSSPSCVNMEGHSYVMVDGYDGEIKDVPDLCRVNLIYTVPQDVHDILADGFELRWYNYSYKRPYPGDLLSLFVEGEEEYYAASCNTWYTTPPVLLSFLMLFLPAILALIGERRHLSMYDNIEKFLQSHDNDLVPIRYTYSEIKKITNGFKDKLGEGGFDSVYKGKLRSGRFAAVKLLAIQKQWTRFYQRGFSVEGSKRALIYEFMPNGSLERYIFSRQGSVPLSNEKLYEISLGVARGIQYLHQDFGLAKLYPTNNNTVPLTAARGTIGYMAPELFYKNIGGVSYKADVYSYGMLLMEMVGRRKNLNANHSSQLYFPSWAYDQVNEGKDIEDATEHEKKTTTKMIIVALWCIQLKPVDRPSMHKVVEMLESDVESLRMPPKPFLTPHQVQEDDYRANNAKLSDPPNDMDSSYQFGR